MICALAAALLVLASSSKNFVAVYVLITLVSTLLSLVLYAVCAAAALKLKVARGSTIVIIAIALLYSIAMFVGAGTEAFLWSLILGVAGFPIRWLSRRFSSSAATPQVAAPAAPPGSSA